MRPRSNLTDVSVWFWPILTAVVGVALGAAGRVTPRFELVPTGACMTTVVTLVALVSPRGALLSLPFALLSIADTIRIRVGPAGFEGSDLALTLLRLSSLAAVLWLAGAVRSHVSRPTRENETAVSGGADSDIGDRRRAEEALRESEAFLRFSQKVGQVGSWDWDPRTDRVVWSDEMCRIHGIDPEAFGGTLEGALAFLVRGEPDRRREVRAKLLAVAGTRTRDYEIQRADGCTRMLWTQFLVSHDDRGRPIRVVGITQDVTDRLETDEAFRRQTQILERVFANLDEGVVVTDPDGRLALWNDVIDSTFGRLRPGVTRSEWAARFAARRMDGTPFAGDELPLTRALGGETLRDEPARVTTASGATERVFSVSAAPVKNEDGASLGAVSIFRDITEERRARAALERSREQLRRLAARSRDVREQERTAVAREIHDELGQALTSLRMDLGWLHAETSADRLDVADRLRAMTALVDATVHTVRRIASSLRPAMLDDLGLVAAMEWQVREFEQRSGLRCETVFPTTDVPIAPDRATAVFRIFQEALTNVARHADATQVRVRLAVNDGGVALEVSDDGKGISDDALLRVDALGLIGMRERAETLGGVWRIRGGAGRRHDCDTHTTAAARGSTGMINVMIADDHPIVRRGLRGIIEDVAGMRLVGEVADGYQVLAQIQERDVDVVILDISMPGPGFLDVLRQLREEKPTARVLVLSLHPEELYAVRALRAGAAGYLTKDHTTEQLAAAVKHVHAGHRYVTPSLADRLASGLEEDPTRPRHEQLSDREFEVLRLLASGFGVTDIGRELALSPKTISTYRTRILEKMQVSSNAELVRYAVEHGLL